MPGFKIIGSHTYIQNFKLLAYSSVTVQGSLCLTSDLDGTPEDWDSLDAAQLMTMPLFHYRDSNEFLNGLHNQLDHLYLQVELTFEPVHEKTNNGFRLGPTQTGLCSHRR